MSSTTEIPNDPLFDQLHEWYQMQSMKDETQKWECMYCLCRIHAKSMPRHMFAFCGHTTVYLSPDSRDKILLTLQKLNKMYSNNRKPYWKSSQEVRWLNYQAICGWSKEKGLKYWLFITWKGDLEWETNQSLSNSRLGSTLIQFARRHIKDLLEFKKPVLNLDVHSAVDGKILIQCCSENFDRVEIK